MALKTYPFDPADYIDTPESQVELLVDAFETEDVTYIANAIRIVAPARGIYEVARQAV